MPSRKFRSYRPRKLSFGRGGTYSRAKQAVAARRLQRFARRSFPRRRAAGGAGGRRAIARIKRTVMSMAESKKLTATDVAWVDSGTLGISTSGYLYDPVAIAQGDGSSNREGADILPTRLSFGDCYANPAETPSNAMRFIVFRCVQTDGHPYVPALGDFPTVDEVLEPSKHKGKYTILYDSRRMQLNWKFTRKHNDLGAWMAQPEPVQRRHFKPPTLLPGKGLPKTMKWQSGTTGAYAPDEEGRIGFYMVSDSDLVSHPTIRFNFQFHWKDL